MRGCIYQPLANLHVMSFRAFRHIKTFRLLEHSLVSLEWALAIGGGVVWGKGTEAVVGILLRAMGFRSIVLLVDGRCDPVFSS